MSQIEHVANLFGVPTCLLRRRKSARERIKNKLITDERVIYSPCIFAHGTGRYNVLPVIAPRIAG
jgi:hypothetical protein